MREKRVCMLVFAIINVMFSFANDSIRIVKDIELTSKPRSKEIKDSEKHLCKEIRIWTNDTTLDVETLFKVHKERINKNEIRIWVTHQTRVLTFSADNVIPYRYRISDHVDFDTIDQKQVYEMTVEVHRDKVALSPPFFINAGFNVVSIMGPSLSVGYHFGNFNVEAGVVLGLNKSDDWYFYKKGESLYAAHSYKAIRAYLRGGYDLKFGDNGFFILEPQVGVAYNGIRGGDVSTDFSATKDDYMKNLGSVSALAAVRCKFGINDHLKIHVTPEYDFGVIKNNNVKELSDKDSKVKSWTDGFNLNVGLMIYL